jgi:hypothetical protein
MNRRLGGPQSRFGLTGETKVVAGLPTKLSGDCALCKNVSVKPAVHHALPDGIDFRKGSAAIGLY